MKTSLLLLLFTALVMMANAADPSAWQLGTPIVTYWAGPSMSDAVARQMSAGGWNLVWCDEKDLDTVRRHGLRAQLGGPLLNPAALDNAAQRDQLNAMIDRVRTHPALYAYFLTDEPNRTNFPGVGRMVAHLRSRDPAHLAYINLYPTYASNEQLGNRGDTVPAYTEHLRDFLEQVKPGLISYDHYQFSTNGDTPHYFLNLSLIRRAALEADLPFLNIVQACTWTPSMRVPGADEMRYLVHTTLAYGAQGISYYVYGHPGHTGGIANPDGTPTALYPSLAVLNREFVAVATQLQPLRSLGAHHAGMLPPGAEPLPAGAAFTLDPPIPTTDYQPPRPVKGVLLGLFGPRGSAGAGAASHVFVVNLDYAAEVSVGLRGPGRLETFDSTAVRWTSVDSSRLELRLPRGGGRLVRVVNRPPK